jgi:hypothetical protein
MSEVQRGALATEYALAHGDAQTRADFLAGWDAAISREVAHPMVMVTGDHGACREELDEMRAERDAALSVIASTLAATKRGNLMTPPWVVEALSALTDDTPETSSN